MNHPGAGLKKLGFGLMRLPTLPDGGIDIEQVKTMADRFLARGFTYFDTAYVYGADGASERAFREAVARRYPRGAYQIADKLPLWGAKSKEDLLPLFNTSLERTGVEYFDYYLLHNISNDRIQGADRIGAWDFLRELKERGLAKHIGFSSHGNAEQIDDLLTRHPEAEFIQLQISYADWESVTVQSRLCYEAARRHNMPVIVMEPLKGGFLAELPDEAIGRMKAVRPDLSPAAWGNRFAASLEGIITVLSGMSSLAQMEDNLSHMDAPEPLSPAEREVLLQVCGILEGRSAIPCTNCQYCLAACPKKIRIPGLLRILNEYRTFGPLPGLAGRYWMETEGRDGGGKAKECVACRACEALCPQNIEISSLIPAVSQIYDT